MSLKKLFALALAAGLAGLAGCGSSSDVTGPSPSTSFSSSGTVAESANPPAPAASPAPAPYADFNKVLKDGSGQLCNPTGHPAELKVEYFDATNFQNQQLLTTKTFTVGAGKCSPVPPASEVLTDLACGQKLTLQLDASTKSAHIGHVFVDLTTGACGCEDYSRPGPTKFAGSLVFQLFETEVEVQVEGARPEGSTFFPNLPAKVARPSYGSPESVFSTTQTFTGTYGPEGLGCSYTDSRVLEIVIPPQECKEDAKVTTEVIEGPWSEVLQGEGGKCFQYRQVTTIIKTDYQCKEDTEEVSTISERREVECPSTCEASTFWDQHVETNKNQITGVVHVRGEGAWSLKLFATSSPSEYPESPDYLKDVDSVTIECKGEGELKVQYAWKGHPSKYWWAALYRNNQRVWLGERIEK